MAALGRYDNNEFDDSLAEFDKINDTSKILFNMGVIHATLGEHEKAVRCNHTFWMPTHHFSVNPRVHLLHTLASDSANSTSARSNAINERSD